MKILCLFVLPLYALGGGETSKHATFQDGYAYDYFFKAETEIMGMDNLTTEMQVRELSC